MRIEEVRRVLILGAGTMGQEIGLQCAMHGYDVVLYDIAAEKLDIAAGRQKATVAGFVREGRLTQEDAAAAMGKVSA